MITAVQITKSFGSLQVLKGIDLSVAASEVVSIVGPSGAGKTTLGNLLPAAGPLGKGGSENTAFFRQHLVDERGVRLPGHIAAISFGDDLPQFLFGLAYGLVLLQAVERIIAV